FKARILNDAAAFDEATAEDAFPALVEELPITHGICGRIGGVSHQDGAGISAHMVETTNHGAAKAVWTGILNGYERGDFALEFLQHHPSPVAAAIVDDNNFMRDIFRDKRLVQISQGRRQC